MSNRSKKRVVVNVADEQTSAQGFVDAWKRAEQGKRPRKQREFIHFADMDILTRTLSNKRLALLQHLRKQPSLSIKALAEQVQRNYKNVYDDVKLLKNVGLIDTDEDNRLVVPWDVISINITLAA